MNTPDSFDNSVPTIEMTAGSNVIQYMAGAMMRLTNEKLDRIVLDSQSSHIEIVRNEDGRMSVDESKSFRGYDVNWQRLGAIANNLCNLAKSIVSETVTPEKALEAICVAYHLGGIPLK